MHSRLKLLTLAAVLAAGCETIIDTALDCTQIGCINGLSMLFEVADHGTWHFELDLVTDGEVTDTVTCQGTLPLTETSADGCDNASVILSRSGSALAESEHRLAGLELIELTPDEIDVRVFLDDEAVLSETIVPTYNTHSPNGEACGPTCYSGAISLDLD